jgi:UDP-GlcNAc:undecaprenyl-phosphate/decaprenyl-phosphate GlcNAc-1-phosphate transferase
VTSGELLRAAIASIGSFGLTFSVLPLAIRAAYAYGLLDHPVGWKQHRSSTPYLGGAAVVFGVLVTFAVLGESSEFTSLILGTAFLCVVGTLDDRFNLPALTRIVAVIAAALGLSATGNGWTLFDDSTANAAFTVIWTLGVVNAINLLDLMDGTATGVSVVSAIGIATAALLFGSPEIAILASSLAGAGIAFLRQNLQAPSRVFLGDGGSMPIGFLLAGLLVDAQLGGGLAGLIGAFMFVAIPVLDMVFRILSRIRDGIPLLQAGPDSVANWFRARGNSPRHVSIRLGGAQAVMCSLGIAGLGLGSSVTWITFTGVAVLSIAAVIGLWASGFPRSHDASASSAAAPAAAD